MDEAYGLLCLSIYPDILFHFDGLKNPIQLCIKLYSLFGVHDEIRTHQLENELISLSPSSFESIERLFTKFKSHILMLKNVGLRRRNINLLFPSSQNWVLNTQFLCQLFMLLGLLFRIGKCILWVHFVIHWNSNKINWSRWVHL